jgi:T-complex protein 1 subunit alpha
VRYPVKAINVLKAHGKSAADSALLPGYALNMGRAAQGMPRRVVGAKIACLDMNLQKTRMQVRARASLQVQHYMYALMHCQHVYHGAR